MEKRGLGRVVLCLVAMFLVCWGFASGSAEGKTDICHFDKDAGTWKLLSVGNPAVNAHLRNHDDGLPGGLTTQSGTELDENCAPVPKPLFMCPPRDQGGFDLDVHDDTIFCSYPVVPGEDPFDFYCRYNPTTGVLVEDHDAGLCFPNAVPLP